MALSQAQLDALNGVTDMTSQQSATVLGHSTSQFDNFMKNTALGIPQRLQESTPPSGNVDAMGVLKGEVKGATQTLNSANSLEASARLGGGTTLQKATGVNLDTATKANTFSEQLGKSTEQAGELALGAKVAPEITPKNPLSMVSDLLNNRSTARATKAVQSTAETMTKGERLAASDRLVAPKTYAPSQTEQRAGGLLKSKVGSNSIKNPSIVKKEIAQRSTQAEQFLGENGRPVSQDQLKEVFDKKRVEAGAYLSPSQMADYDHTIAQFQSELSKMSDVNTGTVYKALKNFEQNVTARLPKGNEALLTDSGSAKLEAAKMVRTGIRDMIGQMHPEFKEQMFDIASLYDALDNVIVKAEQKTSTIKPILKKALTWGAEAVGAGFLYKGAKDVGAPLP